jgi:hypothetical protein
LHSTRRDFTQYAVEQVSLRLGRGWSSVNVICELIEREKASVAGPK